MPLAVETNTSTETAPAPPAVSPARPQKCREDVDVVTVSYAASYVSSPDLRASGEGARDRARPEAEAGAAMGDDATTGVPSASPPLARPRRLCKDAKATGRGSGNAS